MSEQGTPGDYDGPERRQLSAGALTTGELAAWRRQTAELTAATEELARQLGDLVTRGEVHQEVDVRLEVVERDVAAYISGAKRQIHRTRRAGWIMQVCGLLLVSFLVIQLHDIHVQECVVNPITSGARRWACDAAMPLHSHHSAGDTVNHSHAFVPPRTVGLLLYLGLLGGFAYGSVLYRRRRADERKVLAVSPVQQAQDARDG